MSEDNPISIDRRDAIRLVTTLLGGVALVGGNALLTACQTATRRDAGATPFSGREIALLDEIAETILPETSTPGAKAAETGPFMALMVTDTYHEDDRRIFRDGLRDLEARSVDMHGAGFMAATPDQRRALLEVLDREQKAYMDTRAPGAPAHYFRMMKELALLGYFTSEIGYTQAMRYVEAPGRYEPCVPYTRGERIWAPHA